jgi:hypothetical protein
MRDFGFIKEYVKGLGVIGAYVRTYVPPGYLLRAIRTGIRTYSFRYSDLLVPCPCHSHPFSCYSYSVSGLIRTLSVLFARFSQGVRPAMAVPPGIRPRAATPYRRERSV